jgi:hypothetical protein
MITFILVLTLHNGNPCFCVLFEFQDPRRQMVPIFLVHHFFEETHLMRRIIQC